MKTGVILSGPSATSAVRAEDRLLELLGVEHGLILGDIAQALGKVGSRRAAPVLEAIRDHESEWVRQNVNFALRRFADRG